MTSEHDGRRLARWNAVPPRPCGCGVVGCGFWSVTGAVFRDMDENKDGHVSKAEFRKVLPLLGVSTASEADVDALFDLMDEDRSGTHSIQTCVRLLRASRERRLYRECRQPSAPLQPRA